MFKNAIMFRISSKWTPDLRALEDGLAKNKFVSCGATQQQSIGWIEPRGEAHGPMVEVVGGHWFAKICIETKKVPASHVQNKLIERLLEIEKATGRKPGRKESKELKEDIILDLLPHAFPTQGVTSVWIDPNNRTMVINAGSLGKCDALLTGLLEACEDLVVSQLQTNSTPSNRMSEWLVTQEPPAPFSIGQECELKSMDESKSVVRYGHHPLDIEEIAQHIDHGKVPTKLAMSWNDRMAFLLTDTLMLKKITYMDVATSDGGDDSDDGSFDTDMAIMTGEMTGLIKDLISAHDGEAVLTD